MMYGYGASLLIRTPQARLWEQSDNSYALLRSCYKSCLREAEAHEVRSIAFPLISTGVYGFPRDRAARIALDVLKDSPLDITIVCYLPQERKEYDELMHSD